VTQLDQMTQQNAALVEQSSAAAESLREQANHLAQAVGVFKLAQGETRSVIAQAQSNAKSKAAALRTFTLPAANASGKSTSASALPAKKPALKPALKPGSKPSDQDWEEF